MRILVVDDDPSVRKLLSLQLEIEGHDVAVAEDGAAALACIDDVDPHAMVLDVMMPVLSGWEVLERLRADDRYRRLPVVLLSARDVPDDVRHGYERGASAVLAKPFDFEQLYGVLEAVSVPR